MTIFDNINILKKGIPAQQPGVKKSGTAAEGGSSAVKNGANDRGVFVQGQQSTSPSQTSQKNAIYQQQDLNNIFQQGVQNYTPAKSAFDGKSYANINNLKSTADVSAAMQQLKTDMRGCSDAAQLQKFMDMQADLSMRMEVLEQKEASEAGLADSDKTLSAAQNQENIEGNENGGTVTVEDEKKDVSVEGGMAQAAEAEKGANDVKSQTKEVKAQGKEANSIAKDAEKTTKTLTKDIKNLDKQYKSEVKAFDKNSQSVAKLSKQMQDGQSELNALQDEADAILDKTGSGTKSANSLTLGGDEEGLQKKAALSDEDNKMLDEINNKMSNITTQQQGYSSKLNSASRKMRTSNTKMTNTVKMKEKYYAQNVKTLEKQEAANNKIEKFAQKVEDISTTVKNVGSITQKTGKIMIATGTAMCSNPFTAAAGAALVKAGGVVNKVGIVTEKVGTVGVAAAQVTKTASALAEGNLTKALATAGSAVQTAAAAMKGVQSMGQELKAVDAQVADGVKIANETQEAAAQTKAKIEQAKNEAAGALDGSTGSSSGGLKGLFEQGKEFYDNNKDTIGEIISDGKDVLSGINGLKTSQNTSASSVAQQTYASNPNQNSASTRAGLNNGSIVSESQWAALDRMKNKMNSRPV